MQLCPWHDDVDAKVRSGNPEGSGPDGAEERELCPLCVCDSVLVVVVCVMLLVVVCGCSLGMGGRGGEGGGHHVPALGRLDRAGRCTFNVLGAAASGSSSTSAALPIYSLLPLTLHAVG